MKEAELQELLADALSPEVRAEFAESHAAQAQWSAAHPIGLGETLAWIGALRRVFGDPPIDTTPWVENDLRL